MDWRMGNEAIPGYGQNMADPNVPNLVDLGRRILAAQREHSLLLLNGKQNLNKAQQDTPQQKLDKMRRIG